MLSLSYSSAVSSPLSSKSLSIILSHYWFLHAGKHFSAFEHTGIQGILGHKSHVRRPLPNPVATTEPWWTSTYPASHQNLCALSLTQRTKMPPCWSLSNRCSHHSTLVVRMSHDCREKLAQISHDCRETLEPPSI